MGYDLSGLQVLVVDDDEDTADLFADILERAGAVVQRATNLLDAVDRIREIKIGVVATDLAMPGGTGWDLAREVRQVRPMMPIVAVTGRLLPASPQWLIDQGFSAILFKPVDPAQLVAVIWHLSASTGVDGR